MSKLWINPFKSNKYARTVKTLQKTVYFTFTDKFGELILFSFSCSSFFIFLQKRKMPLPRQRTSIIPRTFLRNPMKSNEIQEEMGPEGEKTPKRVNSGIFWDFGAVLYLVNEHHRF